MSTYFISHNFDCINIQLFNLNIKYFTKWINTIEMIINFNDHHFNHSNDLKENQDNLKNVFMNAKYTIYLKINDDVQL